MTENTRYGTHKVSNKGRIRVEQIANGHKQDGFLRKLYPVFELSALIRPRGLWVAPVLHQPPILLGLVYNTQKDALQYRLRFQLADQPEVFRRTRWRTVTASFVRQQSVERIQQAFATMASQVGSGETFALQFVPEATDAEILRLLFASRLPRLFDQS
jgi:hypothetical protein